MNLIQVLLAFVVAYLSGDYPSKRLSKALSASARRESLAVCPGLREALAAYDAGEELPWIEMSAAVKEAVSIYSSSASAKASYVKALNAFATYFRTGSDRALKSIEKLSALVNDPALSGYFVKTESDQRSLRVQLETIVKSMGGRGFALTLDQSKETKAADPDQYAEYLSLMRAFNESWKTVLSNYVRAQGTQTVPFRDFLKHLQQNGYTHTLAEGFTGNVDANGSWYTKDGKLIAGGAPGATMFPTVRMNPKPSPESPWVFQAIRADGSPGNYFYTEEFQRRRAAEKFEKVAAFDVDKTRKRWLSVLKGFNFEDPDAKQVASLVLEILYRTSNRIGTRPGGNPTGGGFGINTLLVAHFYPQTDGSVKFIYLGKDDVRTVSVIKPSDNISKFVCKAVYALVEGKGKNDPIFTYRLNNGQNKLVQPAATTKFFQSISGGLNPHKLRTAKGTALFMDFIDTVYAKHKTLTPKQVIEFIKKAGTVVGKQLNHVRRSAEGTATVQPMTSLKNYIDVAAQIEFFQHYGCPIPAYLEKFMMEQAAAEDKPEDPNEEGERGDQGDVVSDEVLLKLLQTNPEDMFIAEFG